jgi:hypothetical protein
MPKKRKWIFTEKRKLALKSAQEEHVNLVELGLRVRGARAKAKFAKSHK